MSIQTANTIELPVAEDFSDEVIRRRRVPSRHFTKMILFAPLGMMLVGAGLCIFAEAHEMKVKGEIFINWFCWGTGSLVLINAGLAFIGEAVKSKVMLELRKKRSKSR